MATHGATLVASDVTRRWRGAGVRGLVGLLLLVLASMVGTVETPGSRSAVALCGTGVLDTEITMTDRGAMVSGLVLSGLGPDCEGRAVGADLIGSDRSTMTSVLMAPDTVLAAVWSDQDACRGTDLLGGDGLVSDGAVRVALCEGHDARGWVPVDALEQLSLVTRDADSDVSRSDVKIAARAGLEPAAVTVGGVEVVPAVLTVLALGALLAAGVHLVGRNRVLRWLRG